MGKLKEGEGGCRFVSLCLESIHLTTHTQDAFTSTGNPGPESLEVPLGQLRDLGLGGEVGEDEPDEAELAAFLENMTGGPMSKEALYEPLTELAEKFPPYLATPPTLLAADDRARYESQLERVKAILAVFDKPDFDDADPKARESVVGLMAEMQFFGAPPTELMGPLLAVLGALRGEEGCTVA
ncbi:Pex19 protein family-domain-containing protein [Mycena crocata]|nr:Pex19 protein family-domain-containing protein [Mycena crocata]